MYPGYETPISDTAMRTMHIQNILSAVLACSLMFTTTGTQAQAVSSAEARAIAQDAYTYFYPLVIMDVSRKHFTNIEPDKMFARGPMNTFSHARTFPPATFRGATHANFDTLYSVGWLDLTKEPVIISVPDTHGRYYLLQLLDMWTDSFGELGSALLARAPAVLPWLALAGRVSSPLARNESTPRLRSEATIQSQR